MPEPIVVLITLNPLSLAELSVQLNTTLPEAMDDCKLEGAIGTMVLLPDASAEKSLLKSPQVFFDFNLYQ